MWKNVGTLEDFLEYQLTAKVRCQSVDESLLDDPPFREVQILWNLDLVVVDGVPTMLIPVPREQEWIVLDVVVVAVAANYDNSVHTITFCTKTTRRS